MCQRPYSIRTRIKTSAGCLPWWHGHGVRDHIPLEQGLRLIPSLLRHASTSCQRPYSIRTRIKTERRNFLAEQGRVRDHIPLEQGLRPPTLRRRLTHVPVRDHIPLEQGLRLRFRQACAWVHARQRPYSIRTRIKTSPMTPVMMMSWRVRDHIPLEQGLRPTPRGWAPDGVSVRDHIPLEQGLRQGSQDYKEVLPRSETIFH